MKRKLVLVLSCLLNILGIYGVSRHYMILWRVYTRLGTLFCIPIGIECPILLLFLLPLLMISWYLLLIYKKQEEAIEDVLLREAPTYCFCQFRNNEYCVRFANWRESCEQATELLSCYHPKKTLVTYLVSDYKVVREISKVLMSFKVPLKRKYKFIVIDNHKYPIVRI